MVLDLIYRTLLLPPGNRFIVPVSLGLVMAWRQRQRPVTTDAAAVSNLFHSGGGDLASVPATQERM